MIHLSSRGCTIRRLNGDNLSHVGGGGNTSQCQFSLPMKTKINFMYGCFTGIIL